MSNLWEQQAPRIKFAILFFHRGRGFSTFLPEHQLLEIQEVKATLNEHPGDFCGKLLSRHLHLSLMDSSIQDFDSSVYSTLSSLCSCSMGHSAPLWFSEDKLELENFLAQLRCFHPLETTKLLQLWLNQVHPSQRRNGLRLWQGRVRLHIRENILIERTLKHGMCCPGKQLSHHLWRYFNSTWMWYLGTWFSSDLTVLG